MRRRWRNVHVFTTKTDVAQNLIDNCFSNLTDRGHFHRKDFKWKKFVGTVLTSAKKEALYAWIFKNHMVAILKKNYLWLLPFYMTVATYIYYEKVRWTIRTTLVSCLLKSIRKVIEILWKSPTTTNIFRN